MKKNKSNNCKSEILKVLEDSPMGLTITEISSEIGFNRNTVSKHLEILETAGLVSKKEISRAKVFFSKKRKYLPRTLMTSFIQALLSGYKKELPDKAENLKSIGRRILDHFQFPIGKPIIKEFDRVKKLSDPHEYLKLFQEFYNSFDLFQDDLDISIVELHDNKVIYRLKNSDFLDPSKDSTFFFYLACGITEALYIENLDKRVLCNVENIHISSNKEESFIEISLEIQE